MRFILQIQVPALLLLVFIYGKCTWGAISKIVLYRFTVKPAKYINLRCVCQSHKASKKEKQQCSLNVLIVFGLVKFITFPYLTDTADGNVMLGNQADQILLSIRTI